MTVAGRKSKILHNDRPRTYENVHVWTPSYPSGLLPTANAKIRNLKINGEQLMSKNHMFDLFNKTFKKLQITLNQ